jgi:acetyltransferase-like isoleucine patch superfamily enzyme
MSLEALKNYKIHPLADVQSSQIGEGTTIWQFCVILKNAKIGNKCNINCQVFIENDVVIGNNVTIKPGVQLWDGLRIADDVFIGPNVTFTNDTYPRSKQYPEKFLRTIVEKGASIGANATILPKVRIGEYALIGAGSVVLKDVERHSIVVGNPAQKTGYITREGIKLSLELCDNEGNQYKWFNNQLLQK